MSYFLFKLFTGGGLFQELSEGQQEGRQGPNGQSGGAVPPHDHLSGGRYPDPRKGLSRGTSPQPLSSLYPTPQENPPPLEGGRQASQPVAQKDPTPVPPVSNSSRGLELGCGAVNMVAEVAKPLVAVEVALRADTSETPLDMASQVANCPIRSDSA